VDDAGDVITEALNQGTDLVKTALTTYTLGANLEQLQYTGEAAFTGTGNNLANKILGGTGNDTLDGGTNADRMEGGAGDDTYIVDRAPSSTVDADGNVIAIAGDVAFEGTLAADSGGTDTVMASVTFTLGVNVENLTLTGELNINGTGNALDNTLTGNAGKNTLRGGAGSDIFVFDNLAAVDKIADFASGADRIALDDAIFTQLTWDNGALAAGQFESVTSTAAASEGMRLVYNSKSGELFYDADGTDTGDAATLFAVLTTHPVLAAADFMSH